MKADSKSVARRLSGAPGRAIKIPHLADEKAREQGPADLRQVRGHRSSNRATGKVANRRHRQSARHPGPQPFVQPIRIEFELGETFSFSLRRESADPVSPAGRTLDSN
jgi:hypothetical protein